MLVDGRDYSSSSLSDGDLHHLTAQNGELEAQLAKMHLSLGGNHFDERSAAGPRARGAHQGALLPHLFRCRVPAVTGTSPSARSSTWIIA